MKTLTKIVLILILTVTFYFGVLEGTLAYFMGKTPDEPLLSGVFTGFFILFLILSPRVFKL